LIDSGNIETVNEYITSYVIKNYVGNPRNQEKRKSKQMNIFDFE